VSPQIQATQQPAAAGAVVFLAPHYDDAVLSCGAAIAGTPRSVVVTIFSGGPSAGDPISPWDRRCGFAPGDDVGRTRECEDEDALALLGARGLGLGFMPTPYRVSSRSGLARLARAATRLNLGKPASSELQAAIAAKLAEELAAIEVATCVIPLGVSHADHLTTTDSALSLVQAFPAYQWVAYADLPYSAESAEAFNAARTRISSAGFRLDAMVLTQHPDLSLKLRAVERYRSQLQGLGERVAVALSSPERYYTLVPDRASAA
jgi:LmbE family N-acetylglucosaminyl deacetylase